MQQTKAPAEILREFLEEKGWTQATLAETIGVSQVTVSRICMGKSVISISMARKLAAAFGNQPIQWLHWQAAWALKEVEEAKTS